MVKQKSFLLVAIIIILAAAALFMAYNETTKPSLSVDFSQPTPGIGFVDIVVSSDVDIHDVNVKIGWREAELVSADNNVFTFSFFVSPYDEEDFYTVEVSAKTQDNEILTDDSERVDARFSALADMKNGLLLYSETLGPIEAARSLVEQNTRLNFFFELDPGVSSRNAVVVDSYHPLIAELAHMNKTVNIYGVETVNNEWISCASVESASLPVAECEQIFETGPSIITRLPIYPTSQVKVSGRTIEMLAKQSELRNATRILMVVVNPPPIIIGMDASQSSPEQ